MQMGPVFSATVTKRFVNVKNILGNEITLFEGTELSMWERPEGGIYEATIASGQQSTHYPLILTKEQAAMWLVFRTAESLGYTKA